MAKKKRTAGQADVKANTKLHELRKTLEQMYDTLGDVCLDLQKTQALLDATAERRREKTAQRKKRPKS